MQANLGASASCSGCGADCSYHLAMENTPNGLSCLWNENNSTLGLSANCRHPARIITNDDRGKASTDLWESVAGAGSLSYDFPEFLYVFFSSGR